MKDLIALPTEILDVAEKHDALSAKSLDIKEPSSLTTGAIWAETKSTLILLGSSRRMTRLQLVPPSTRYRDSFLRALEEFQAEGLPWWLGPETQIARSNFDEFVRRKIADSTPSVETDIPKSHYWAVSGGQFVGRISVYHDLNDALRRSGGHVGYDTVPSFRGRGFAAEMLKQLLPIARQMNLHKILLTCDSTNSASVRVIERNGGILADTKVLEAGRPSKRYYWIEL